MRSSTRRRLLGASAVLLAAGCNQIFGIEAGNLVPDPIIANEGGADVPTPDVVNNPDSPQPPPDSSGTDTTPVPTTIVDLALGQSSTCVALSTGVVRCWGGNMYGQLGNGTTVDSPNTPVTVKKLTNVKRIAGGLEHVCALLADTSVSCWGSDGARQIGVLTNDPCNCVSTPADVGLLATDAGTLAISAGGFMSMALRGPLYHWGGWTAGGGSTNAPTAYSLGGDTVDEAHAGDNLACYRTGGTIKCWGLYDDAGELGRGVFGAGDPTPAAVVNITDWQQFSIGNDHTCGLRTNGEVWCWGSGAFGKLGTAAANLPKCNNNAPCSDVPLKVSLNGKATAVAVGDSTSCALLSDQSVWCWGTNTYGECGHPAPVVDAPPTQSDVSNVVQLVLNGRHVCAVLSDYKTLKCWGRNDMGQLGYNASGSSIVPTSVIY